MGASYTPEEWDEWTATMQAKHGNGNGHGKSLSIEAQRLLPTPVSDNSRGLPSSTTDYASLANVAASLLPTPRATDGTKGGPNQRGSSGDLMLPSAVHALLPTPNASLVGPHGERGPRTLESRKGKQVELPDVIAHAPWGDYAPAIARWESVIGRPAPAPTEPGKNGNPRLSPLFVEWLMGLPEGHVTDPAIGITRNDQLKALGNGVVPQQAAAATQAFLADFAALEVTA